MTAHSITIKRETASDEATVDRLGRILADGFGPGYLTEPITGGDLDLLVARMRMRIYEGVKDLEVYSAAVDGEEPGAVMIVAKPGLMWGETPNAKNHYGEISDAMQADRPHLAAASKKLGEEFHHLEEHAWGPETTKPFYYVTYLSTSPSAQRKGLGRALIRTVLERSEAEGIPTVLLTQNEENVAWYSKLGFRDVAKRQFKLRDTDVSMWAMTTELA